MAASAARRPSSPGRRRAGLGQVLAMLGDEVPGRSEERRGGGEGSPAVSSSVLPTAPTPERGGRRGCAARTDRTGRSEGPGQRTPPPREGPEAGGPLRRAGPAGPAEGG